MKKSRCSTATRALTESANAKCPRRGMNDSLLWLDMSGCAALEVALEYLWGLWVLYEVWLLLPSIVRPISSNADRCSYACTVRWENERPTERRSESGLYLTGTRRGCLRSLGVDGLLDQEIALLICHMATITMGQRWRKPAPVIPSKAFYPLQLCCLFLSITILHRRAIITDHHLLHFTSLPSNIRAYR